MDGQVIISITGDTKDFDRKYNELEKKYQSKEISVSITEKELNQAKAELEKLVEVDKSFTSQLEKQKASLQEQEEIIRRIKATPRDYTTQEGRLENIRLGKEESEARNQITSLNRRIGLTTSSLLENSQLLEKQEIQVDKINAKYIKQQNELDIIRGKMSDLSTKEITNVSHSMDNTSKSANNVLHSIRRWGLAIFGIRGTYMFIRTIMNSVTNQNKELGAQLDGLKQSFGQAFTPIIEKIINLVKTLMAYINYMTKELFGKELFSSKVSKDLSSGAKSAKEINKQLAGFDEANVLNSNNTSGGGAGGGTTDLGFADIKIPQWLKDVTQWIKDNPKWAGILAGLTAFTVLGGWKMASGLASAIGGLLGNTGSGALLTGATGLKGLLAALGKLALFGIITIEIVILGEKVAEIIDIYKDWKKAQDRVVKNNDELNKSEKTTVESLAKKKKAVGDVSKETDSYTGYLQRSITTHQKFVTEGDKGNNMLLDGIIGRSTSKKSIETHKDAIIKEVGAYQDLYKQGLLVGDAEYEYYKFLNSGLTPEMYNAADSALNLNKDMKELDTKYSTKYALEMSQTGANKVTGAIQGVQDKFKTLFQKVVDAIKLFTSSNIGAFNNIGTWLSSRFKTIFKADGGIINYPGRGVPIEYRGGEAGREGIIPMDNQQQMALLGQEIAKYVNINNVVNNYMDARKINTLLRQSESKERLANNG